MFVGWFVHLCVHEFVNILEAWEQQRDQRRSSAAAGAQATCSQTYTV